MKLCSVTLPQVAYYYLSGNGMHKMYEVLEGDEDLGRDIEGDKFLHLYINNDDLELFYYFRLILEKSIHITKGNQYLYEYELGVKHRLGNTMFVLKFDDNISIMAELQFVNYTPDRRLHLTFAIVHRI